MFLIMLFAALFGIALGLAISAASKTSEMAIALVPVVILPLMMMGGMMRPLQPLKPLQPLQPMDKVMRVLCYGMASRWAFEAMLVLESDERPLYNRRVGSVTQTVDMAEPYFPTTGDHPFRFGWEISGTVLETMMIVLIISVILILRRRDVH